MKRFIRSVSLGGVLVGIVSAAIAAQAGPAPAKQAAGTIEVWVRAPGAVAGDAAPRARAQVVDLDKLALVDAERVDAQYGGAARAFHGIALASVIDSFKPPASVDLAILHFGNGMAIPVAFRDAATMKRLDPFIARGMETHRKGAIRTAFFTDIKKKGATADARPIVFGGNKLVVAELWHPAVSAGAQASFSPWAHADSLTDIELVSGAAYYRQFDVSVPGKLDVSKGLALFQGSCQFCHGVRKVGARFGWDFVDPTPIYEQRKPSRNLFYHVRYKPLDAAEKGLMMPAMKFMTEADAATLWEWLRAIANKPQPGYTPPAK